MTRSIHPHLEDVLARRRRRMTSELAFWSLAVGGLIAAVLAL